MFMGFFIFIKKFGEFKRFWFSLRSEIGIPSDLSNSMHFDVNVISFETSKNTDRKNVPI